MKQISIVIPVFNEEKFLDGLLQSIQKIDYPKENFEVVVVNDASTDGTAAVVGRYPTVRLLDLQQNVGRYHARKKGAEAALFPNILFIDSRSVVDSNILASLNRLDAQAVSGYSLGAERLGPFETFYKSIRRVLFSGFYKNYNQPFHLTTKNFDTMPKGTTVFYVEKNILFQAFQELAHVDMGKDSSDDTKLLRTIVSQVPILVHPDVKIINFARPSFRANVKHLFDRGAKFIDYYHRPSQPRFWLVVILPLFFMVAALAVLVLVPISALIKLCILFGLDLLIALFLGKSPRDIGIIFIMTPVCTAVFYAGIIRGLWMRAFKAFIVAGRSTTCA